MIFWISQNHLSRNFTYTSNNTTSRTKIKSRQRIGSQTMLRNVRSKCTQNICNNLQQKVRKSA